MPVKVVSAEIASFLGTKLDKGFILYYLGKMKIDSKEKNLRVHLSNETKRMIMKEAGKHNTSMQEIVSWIIEDHFIELKNQE